MLFLALHIHEVSALIVFFVGVLALALAVLGLRARGRSRRRTLSFVAAAFFLFAAKGFFGAWALFTRAIRHEHLELVLALADLAILLLLVVPVFFSKRSPA